MEDEDQMQDNNSLEAKKKRNKFRKGTASVTAAAAAAQSLQSCPTLCDPRDSSPPGSPVPGILQARVLEWGATAFSSKCNYIVSFQVYFAFSRFFSYMR